MGKLPWGLKAPSRRGNVMEIMKLLKYWYQISYILVELMGLTRTTALQSQNSFLRLLFVTTGLEHSRKKQKRTNISDIQGECFGWILYINQHISYVNSQQDKYRKGNRPLPRRIHHNEKIHSKGNHAYVSLAFYRYPTIVQLAAAWLLKSVIGHTKQTLSSAEKQPWTASLQAEGFGARTYQSYKRPGRQRGSWEPQIRKRLAELVFARN